MNYDDFASARLAIVDDVVTALVRETGMDPAGVMLLGAEARDVIHARLGHESALRGTTDLDLGLALEDWSVFEAIDAKMQRTGSTGIRYMIAGVAVDIMPFGSIENPEGIVTPRRRREGLVVFGFEDVFEHADALRLPGGNTIRIPQPAGYAALKLRAWLDRSAALNYKDAVDLAASIYWYTEWDEIIDRAWADLDLLASLGVDQDSLTSTLLGRDIAAQLRPDNAKDLAARLKVGDVDQLAHNMRSDQIKLRDRRQLVRLVIEGFQEAIPD